jgi:hypothetical protein
VSYLHLINFVMREAKRLQDTLWNLIEPLYPFHHCDQWVDVRASVIGPASPALSPSCERDCVQLTVGVPSP